MSLRLKKNRNGGLRPCFYGRLSVGGKLVDVNLGVEWKGTPPPDLRQDGCAIFERSRDRALLKMREIQEEATHKGRVEHLAERLIESKTGRKVAYSRLKDLPDLWAGMIRARPISDSHQQACRSKFEKFEKFMKQPPHSAEFLHEVTESDAGDYLRLLQAEYAGETVRQIINLLRGAFARFLPVGVVNPFRSLVLRGGDDAGSIHRMPFSTSELEKLFEVARPDALFYPLVVCAACTGMRRGDVCRLRWRDVDLKEGMIRCKTGKTGSHVEIPIFAPLLEVLVDRTREGIYVFPEASEMVDNPSGTKKLTRGFKFLVAQALQPENPLVEEAALSPKEALKQSLDVLPRIAQPGSTRYIRVEGILRAYFGGATYREIGETLGVSKGQISGDLQIVEEEVGQRIRRGNRKDIRTKVSKITNVREEGRKNSASVRDWHALRVTFVTLALSAGIPMELVKRITGHQTVDIVLKHYFRPDRDHFKTVMMEKMPEVLTGRSETGESSQTVLKKISAEISAGKNLETNARELLKILDGMEAKFSG